MAKNNKITNETDTLDVLTSVIKHPAWAKAIGSLILSDKPIDPSDLLAAFSPKKQGKIVAFMDDVDAMTDAGLATV